MEIFTVTRNSITDGKLDYCVSETFTDKEAAKACAKQQIEEQARAWDDVPRTFRKVKGRYHAMSVKHPMLNAVITVILEANELK